MKQPDNVTGCININKITNEARQYICQSCPHEKDRCGCPIDRIEIKSRPARTTHQLAPTTGQGER